MLIRGATVLTPDEQIENAAIVLDGDRIAWIGPSGQLPPGYPDQEVDAAGLIAAPGFIDLQLNGAFGDDFTADPSSIWRVAAQICRYGVTSFLPTIVTSPPERIEQAQQVLAAGPPHGWVGALPLGLHLEGPFLNPAKKGAHDARYLRPVDAGLASGWSPATGVRLVTLAIELRGALDLVRSLTERGIVVGAGHSMASFDEAQAGFAAGVRYGTHLFNAMAPLLHREPGLAGALLAGEGPIVGLIPDGRHVHPSVIRIVWAVKGPDEVTLVSDAMAALGMTPGRYRLNDLNVIVTEQDARLADGTLAGSILSLDEALRNLVAYTGCSLSAALAAVTTTPADLLGIGQERGRIRRGLIADLVLMTSDGRICATIAGGRLVGDHVRPTCGRSHA